MQERSLPPQLESEILEILDGSSIAREAALDALCSEHPECADLIRGYANDESCADTESASEARGKAPHELPASIGPYRVLEVLGEGGMGLVYLAEQREPLTRRVALKVIRLGLDTKQVLARFEAERQALAMMQHSGIARVLDAGRTERGQPFFAMELVRGVPLTDYCDRFKLDTRARLELMILICDAVQHAHQKGIVHRDLKPSNILVVDEDGKPVPKIIDFGLARATKQRLTEETYFTAQGALVGTPAYMSPEQADASGLDIDTRTDVYSLGVLLYELLTGQLPFDAQELRRAGYDELQRRIREEEPQKPSTKVTSKLDAVAPERRGYETPGVLARALRGDLDWITMRALEKDRNRRYQTARELASDVQRHLDFEPVEAGPPALGYRLGKFARRYRWQVALAASVLVALMLGLGGMSYLYLEWRDAARDADQQRVLAERNAEEVELRAQKERRLIEQLHRFDTSFRDLGKLEKLAAVDLWPVHPDRADALRSWIEDAESLMERRPLHAKVLLEIRAKGKELPRNKKLTRHPERRLIEGLTERVRSSEISLDQLRRALRGESSDFRGEGLDLKKVGRTLRQSIQSDKSELEALWKEVDALSVFEFEDALDATLERTAEQVVRTLDRLKISLPKVRARLELATSGPGISKAQDLDRWAIARQSIRESERYGGLDFEPQFGLVPLSKDPKTQLWEFAHVLSGVPPVRRADGSLDIDGESAIVLVLLPGGTCRMGNQSESMDKPHYDAQPDRIAMPVLEGELDPFFLSKYEVSQGQWKRLIASVPKSYLKAGSPGIGWNAPMENLRWRDAKLLLERYGLDLPTEAQWEYGARAGTQTKWWTGNDAASLADVANLADASCKAAGAPYESFVAWDDGFARLAPIDALRPNPFGLHNVHGNVWEHCKDAWALYRGGFRRAHDGLHFGLFKKDERGRGEVLRVRRGGDYSMMPRIARSAFRKEVSPRAAYWNTGVRPARAILTK